MPIVEQFEVHVAARLLDFFGATTPWYRRLWCPSVALALKEILEASHAVRSGILSEEMLSRAVQSANLLAGPDPGVGSKEEKRALQQALARRTIVPDGVEYATVKLVAEAVEANYLSNWSIVLANGERPGVERTARSIASHLLDSSFSFNHLHRWCTFQIQNAAGSQTLSELAANADTMCKQALAEYSVLVAFEGVPSTKSGLPPNWVSAQDVALWLTSRGQSSKGLKQNGALLFRIRARDPWAAVQSAVDTVDQLSSRVSLGTHSRLQPVTTAWVEIPGASLPKPFPFRRDSRRVQVHALHREDKLYALEETSIVDAALELTGALNSAPGSTAVGAGWAAVEALLSGPGDADVTAGQRLAALVACSFARAELTDLSYKVEQAGDALATQLVTCDTNRDRARVIADAIKGGAALNLNDASDNAALERVRKLLANPFRVLHDVQNHASAALVRMYKDRNMVLHWGKTDAVGLRSNLRSAAPLVGAGVDRIAHAWFVEKVKPMELAARALYSLETVGSPSGPHVTDLLS